MRSLLVLFLLLHAPFARAGEFTFQFIGNMAFKITDGETTLISDFPYRSGAYGYMEYDMADVKPIVDGVSLITHFHADHWDKKLFAEMDLALIAPPVVLDAVESAKG